MAVPTGRLEDSAVVVEEGREGERLHARHAVGVQEGSRLRLRLVEAAWCVGQRRLQVEEKGRPVGLGDLLGRGGDDRVEVDYLAYRDLRERGLRARPGAAAGEFEVWPRSGPLEGPPAYSAHAVAERSALDVESVAAWAERGHVVALVDEDGAVTHYRAAIEAPEGGHRPGELPRAAATLLRDRVLVADAEAARRFRAAEFLGTPSEAGLFLSLVEAESLRRRGVLEVAGDVAARGREHQVLFPAILQAYEALRAAGVVVKSGFRFGAHLRGYRGDPDGGHAEWIFHCTEGAGLEWSHVSRGVRLAHGVRKCFAFAWSRPGGVRFIGLSWFRP